MREKRGLKEPPYARPVRRIYRPVRIVHERVDCERYRAKMEDARDDNRALFLDGRR